MKKDTRIEKDSMGEVEVPARARYGPQTQRAVNNFTIGREPMPESFIRALLLIKMSAALANSRIGCLDAEIARAIVSAIEKLLAEKFMKHFPVPVLQTGSGTSTNMNANEVISYMASAGSTRVSANDHVNMSQSSNDVIPSAINISATLEIQNRLLPALAELQKIISQKAEKHAHVLKTGRTHLMDALPIRLKDEMNCWASQIEDCRRRLTNTLERLVKLPLGGTAVGTGVNCPDGFSEAAVSELNRISGIEFLVSESFFKGLSSIETPLEASANLKTCACVLMKIANDLRWMNSGPISGLKEIMLPPLQPGSSIMVDKINPVIPEAVCMAAAQVTGNDAIITIGAQAGNFQLNTMFPLVAAKLLESIDLITSSAVSIGEKAIRDMQILEEQMRAPLERNPVLATALNPVIGYMQAARIARKASEEKRTIKEVAGEITDLDEDQLAHLLDPLRMATGKSSV